MSEKKDTSFSTTFTTDWGEYIYYRTSKDNHCCLEAPEDYLEKKGMSPRQKDFYPF